MSVGENVVCGIVSGVIVWWLLDRHKKPCAQAKKPSVIPKPTAFRDMRKDSCGC